MKYAIFDTMVVVLVDLEMFSEFNNNTAAKLVWKQRCHSRFRFSQ